MKKPKIIKSKEETYFIRKRGIPKGCKYCLKGAKTVLFLNGICQNPVHCRWYCPISEERKNKENTYANEIQINNKEQLLDEINLTHAKGMSITGGDPLFEPNLEKTLSYIKYIKKKKSKKFHIHLYTNGLNFNESVAQKLSEAGLDEIRFNPPRDKWFVIEIALNKGLKVGAEVPLIPSQDYIDYLEKFIFYLDQIGADFININEFEMCITNSEDLKRRGFNLKKGTIASVENSSEYALKLLEKVASRVSIKIHFCTIIAKDYWQLAKRYSRRAKSIKKPYELVTEDGLLLYAQIEGNKNNLNEIYKIISKLIKKSKKELINYSNVLKLPVRYLIKSQIRELLQRYDLQAYIIEKTPFNAEKYSQITEKIPLKIFIEEKGLRFD
jgi:pyruvate formate-lyase activating enzyme-like uncharacterized protein